MKYVTAEGSTAKELDIAVAEWLDLGYRPQGGVSVAAVSWRHDPRDDYWDTTWVYAQAMCLAGDGDCDAKG
jgi:hypothetical protein